ncbi:MAG: P1 family peptidase [Rhodothermales bacterium]|nr:P1 family peptidase [Rhodothermales bacterium]
MTLEICSTVVAIGVVLLAMQTSTAQTAQRARDLGFPFEGQPGRLNSITDVSGVEVGYATIVRGSGDLVAGKGPVRTGVTAILPRGKASHDPVFAGWYALNGNGEMTGTAWVEESGFLDGPVMITNTHSVGTVRDAVIKWQADTGKLNQPWSLPVVAETYDGYLNDINGFHVKPEHVVDALNSAAGGAIAEGSIGGGTGMICYEFKGGTGTASRVVRVGENTYTLGVLVQANFGVRHQLTIGGIPVGHHLTDNAPFSGGKDLYNETGSIIVVVATDAPLLPHQLKRIARRVPLGLARTGSSSGNGSGDIFIAFSIANSGAAGIDGSNTTVESVSNNRISALFAATMLATEEAIINALVAADDMDGRDGHSIKALPHEEVRTILRSHNRLVETSGR